MNVSEIIWEIFQSELHDLEHYTSESCQELLTSRVFYEGLVILLLYKCLIYLQAVFPSDFIKLL